MLNAPNLAPLIPQTHAMPNGNTLYCFNNPSLELVKIDFTLESGSAYQTCMSQAHAANQLFAEATLSHTAQQVAEFIDFRGIVVDRLTDVHQGNISVYFLRRYAAEVLPLLREFFDQPFVTPQLFDSYINQRRLKIAQGFLQTNYLARNRFYELLYGPGHPLSKYATVDDLDSLTLECVVDFMRSHYRLNRAHIVLSGQIDAELLSLADQYLSTPEPYQPEAHPILPLGVSSSAEASEHVVLPDAVQSTVRVGAVLPFAWDSAEYARFLVLNTILGGYFGSRLMSNIREDKGYTYGIYSQTQIYRGSIVFFITADVAAEATQPAVDEVLYEMRRLCQEPVPTEELERVRNVMMGDFIRTIDGTFEISERFRQMVASGINERFSANYLQAIQHVSPDQLMPLAQQAFAHPLVVTCGPELCTR